MLHEDDGGPWGCDPTDTGEGDPPYWWRGSLDDWEAHLRQLEPPDDPTAEDD